MTALPLKYRSGEEIKVGDRIRFHGNEGEIEIVASPMDADPATDWYVTEYGGGIMVREPLVFGRAFIPIDQLRSCEDLEFVLRSDTCRRETNDKRPRTND